MEIYNYSIFHILREIEACIDKKLYHVALTTALTLPDICSKLVFDDKNVKKRYVQWCNTYLFEYLPAINNCFLLKTDWGSIIYQLRCGILHNAENDVEMHSEKYETFKVDRFKFYIDDNEKCYTYPMKIYTEKKLRDITTKKKVEIDINIEYMAFVLVQGTLKFIKENKLEGKQFPEIEMHM